MKLNTGLCVVAILSGGMMMGCGGPEEMGPEEQLPAAEAGQTPAAEAGEPPAAEGERVVTAQSFWRYQCGAETVALRDYQYGPINGPYQIYKYWDVRVDIVDGGWWWVYSPNYNRSGWVLASYFC